MIPPNSLQLALLETIFQVAELGNYRLNEQFPTTKAFIDYTTPYKNLRIESPPHES